MIRSLTKYRRRQRTNRAGTTAVEFALVAPIFFLLLITSIDFGRMNVLRHTADNAAYEAARHAMVPGATAAEAVAKANTVLSSVGTVGATVNVSPAVIDLSTDEIIVTVTIPMNLNGWIAPHFTSGKTIVGTSRLKTERVEQQ